MYKQQIEAYFADKEAMLVDAVTRLVSIDSVEGGSAPGAPFGPGPAAALDEALRLAGEWGLLPTTTRVMWAPPTSMTSPTRSTSWATWTWSPLARAGLSPSLTPLSWWMVCSSAGASRTIRVL